MFSGRLVISLFTVPTHTSSLYTEEKPDDVFIHSYICKSFNKIQKRNTFLEFDNKSQ